MRKDMVTQLLQVLDINQPTEEHIQIHRNQTDKDKKKKKQKTKNNNIKSSKGKETNNIQGNSHKVIS